MVFLTFRGAKHLDILRETTNTGWNNAIPLFGPSPQADYGLRLKREAFTPEQLQRSATSLARLGTAPGVQKKLQLEKFSLCLQKPRV
jgi:hypothetical protein